MWLNQFDSSISNGDDFIFFNEFDIFAFEKSISRGSLIGNDDSSNLEVSILASWFLNFDDLDIHIISFPHVS